MKFGLARRATGRDPSGGVTLASHVLGVMVPEGVRDVCEEDRFDMICPIHMAGGADALER